jgi:hypothetical protein
MDIYFQCRYIRAKYSALSDSEVCHRKWPELISKYYFGITMTGTERL